MSRLRTATSIVLREMRVSVTLTHGVHLFVAGFAATVDERDDLQSEHQRKKLHLDLHVCSAEVDLEVAASKCPAEPLDQDSGRSILDSRETRVCGLPFVG